MANTTASTTNDCRYDSSPDPLTGCFMFRSCRDCLNKQGCRIGQDGYCEPDLGPPTTSQSFQTAVAQNLTLPSAVARNTSELSEPQSWTFSASEIRYCPLDNEVCAKCVRENFWLAAGMPADSRFCMATSSGQSCVCVANCATSTTRSTNCPSHRNNDDYDSSADLHQRGKTIMIIFAVLLAVAIVALLTWCAFCIRKKRRARRGAAARTASFGTELEVVHSDKVKLPEYSVLHSPRPDPSKD